MCYNTNIQVACIQLEHLEKEDYNMSLSSEIRSLIWSKHEGEYWDFKKKWYASNDGGKGNMLLDIICMANNIAWHDAYIIIGVDEENDFKALDVTSDENRKNTQNLVCFLKDKKFAGDIRPEVEVYTLDLEFEQIVDVIVIKSTRYTPYYLKEGVYGIHPFHIYTRIQDSNTDRNKSADINIVEKLWANRFSLNAPILEKVQNLLLKPEMWKCEGTFEETYYNTVYPEIKIECMIDEERTGYEYYMFCTSAPAPSWYKLVIKYHQTIIYTTLLASLDEGTLLVPCPDYTYMESNEFFYCYTKGTMQHALYQFFLCKNISDRAKVDKEQYEQCVPIFNSVAEKKNFIKYLQSNFDVNLIKNISTPKFPIQYADYKNTYAFAVIVKKYLDSYRIKLYDIIR